MAVVIALNSRISQVLKLVWTLEIVDCKEKRIISWCFCCYSRKTFSAIKKEIISRKRKDYCSSQADLFYTGIKERASPCLPTFCFLKNTSHCTVPPLQWKVNAVAFIWLRGATIQRSPQNAHCTHMNSTRYSLQLLLLMTCRQINSLPTSLSSGNFSALTVMILPLAFFPYVNKWHHVCAFLL